MSTGDVCNRRGNDAPPECPLATNFRAHTAGKTAYTGTPLCQALREFAEPSDGAILHPDNSTGRKYSLVCGQCNFQGKHIKI